MPATDRPHHFYTKIVGVSHDNEDGTSRQKYIKSCRVGDQLTLDHDEENKFDEFAVRVLLPSGRQIGYLNAELARQVVQRSNTGTRYAAFVSDVTGGTDGKQTAGVNVLMVCAPPGVSNELAQTYINETLAADPNTNLAGDDGASTNRKNGCATTALAMFTLVLVLLIAV